MKSEKGNKHHPIFTWHIQIKGQVQGVGFRPYVFRMAQQHNLTGWVTNTPDGVHVEINATEKKSSIFLEKLIKKAPPLAQITSHSIHQKRFETSEKFQILQSHTAAEPNILLTPDFASCRECIEEVQAEQNRRKGYPFITCTNCGPRFSIIRSLPYDRQSTAMDTFQMCSACVEEYHDPLNRRYFSQTNSCPECSIQLCLFDSQRQEITHDPDIAIQLVVQAWQAGKIVAIKGIGGYLLTCDANNKATLQELRRKKHRPTKPFALMYPDLNQLEKLLVLSEIERKALESPVAPIVLLAVKKEENRGIVKEEIAPGLDQLGVMLPYAPLYHLLLQQFNKPIVATSGNIHNSPIQFEDDKALPALSQIADLILAHSRDIVVPQDDSVLTYTPLHQQRIILRRSRGMAPTYINPTLELPNQTVLATGAMLKSTFTLLHQGNIFISQYLGDLEQFDAQQNYQHTIQHFLTILSTQPAVILTDKHPQHVSRLYAEKLAKDLHVPLLEIQHHVAHFGAVLGENNLVHTKEAVLGVIWDGTGYGDDGQIWGGEFFSYENYRFSRSSHFDYFDFMLGDKMPKEPRIAALAACRDIKEAEAYLKDKFTPAEWQLYSKMLQKGSGLKTSSVGRIFDAVASLLGLPDLQTYEGEAAMQLEAMAWLYFKENNMYISECYFFESTCDAGIPTTALMRGVVLDLQEGKSKSFIAAKFHFSLMKLVRMVAKDRKIKKIAFSGGVFQNSLLVDLMHHYLKDEFDLFFHQELSPNDENVSFGQLICYGILNMKQ